MPALCLGRSSRASVITELSSTGEMWWIARVAGGPGLPWQGRFYSCPLDEAHLWTALRYVELNPVRARMVAEPATWRWSSAAAHCGLASDDTWLDLHLWQQRWTAARWAEFLAAAESDEQLMALRRFTHTGRPLGSATFVAALERLDDAPAHPAQTRSPQKPRCQFRPKPSVIRCLDRIGATSVCPRFAPAGWQNTSCGVTSLSRRRRRFPSAVRPFCFSCAPLR